MTVEISEAARNKIKEIAKRYPEPKSAIMSALYIVQEELGYITEDAVLWLADEIDIAPVRVMELATFYTMYRRRPIGKYHIQMCRTLSCALCGSKKLVEYVKERLNVKGGEVTPDGMWSFEQVECLGSCGTAPVVEINDTYFENLDVEKLEKLMDRIEKEQPDLSYSTVKGSLGAGLEGYPKSEILG